MSYNRGPVRERAMTPNQFRKLALAMPDAIEGAHMGHADFRVGDKIFATLGYPDAAWGVVLLKPDQQAPLLQTAPDIFSPVPGGWGLMAARGSISRPPIRRP